MRSLFFVVGSVALVAACGGGGGGGSGSTEAANPPISTAPVNLAPLVKLNADNYVKAAQNVLFDRGEKKSTPPEVKPSASTLKLAHNTKLLSDDAPLATQAVKSEIENCPGGGTIEYTVNSAKSIDNPQPGDTAFSVHNNCVETDPAFPRISNGNTKTTLERWSSEKNYKSTTVYTDFKTQSNTKIKTVNGDETEDSPEEHNGSLTLQLTRKNFSETITRGATTVNRVFQNYSYRNTTSLQPPQLSSIQAGDLTSSDLGNERFTVSTVQPLTFEWETARQTEFYTIGTTVLSGQLLLTGTNNSQVRLTVQSANTVLLELDTDGDGTYETQTTKPWAELF